MYERSKGILHFREAPSSGGTHSPRSKVPEQMGPLLVPMVIEDASVTSVPKSMALEKKDPLKKGGLFFSLLRSY